MKKLVAIPIYNEKPYIEAVLESVRRYHAGGNILVVDDGSTDGSASILSGIESINVITHQKNLGYGKSLIDSFAYAIENSYDQIVTIDCDEQHEPHHIPEMFDGLGGCDVYSASRYLKEMDGNDKPPEDRYRINMTITQKINKITGYSLTDGFCGLKGYRVDALKRMELGQCCYAFPIEFWIQAYHLGLKVKEFPVERIYNNLNRTFGSQLDNPEKRLKHYENILSNEVKRWQISLPSGPIQTI